ncbi:MAG: hypothetical protein IJ968_02755 [Clostridia bacterium]|nr:hypothetical protein [Clostridia bacterium]
MQMKYLFLHAAIRNKKKSIRGVKKKTARQKISFLRCRFFVSPLMHGIRQVAVSRRPVNDDCFKSFGGILHGRSVAVFAGRDRGQ